MSLSSRTFGKESVIYTLSYRTINFIDFYLMKKTTTDPNLLRLEEDRLLPGISIDCVIIGFNAGTLNVLLNKFVDFEKWMIPGGFVHTDENLNDAATRILKTRTGLDKIFLSQFYTFGDCNRTTKAENTHILDNGTYEFTSSEWFLKRFISVGYFALVDCSKIDLSIMPAQEEVKWFRIDNIPELYADHNKIVEHALVSIRKQLDYIPFGLELLPEKFALSELRLVYETLLGKELDRRNFQRKIMTLDILEKLEEVRKNWGHRTATLYSFNEEKYRKAVEEGISLVNW